MFSRLKPGQNNHKETTSEYIQKISSEGLRCLVLCEKYITLNDYYKWKYEYDTAKKNIKEIEKQLLGTYILI